jgi:hypothetical protein
MTSKAFLGPCSSSAFLACGAVGCTAMLWMASNTSPLVQWSTRFGGCLCGCIKESNSVRLPKYIFQRLRHIFNILFIGYSTSAEFVLGDPSYEWIVLFLVRRPSTQFVRLEN